MTSTQLLDLPVYYVQVWLTTTIRRSVAVVCFRRTFPALDIPGLTGASDALMICMSDLRVAFPRSLFQCLYTKARNEDDEVELFLLPLRSFIAGGCFTHAGRYKGEMQKGCLLFLYEVFSCWLSVLSLLVSRFPYCFTITFAFCFRAEEQQTHSLTKKYFIIARSKEWGREVRSGTV